MIPVQPHVAEMSAYATGPSASVPARFALAQNESVRNPSTQAILAAERAIRTGAFYPDPDCKNLRHALGQLHGLDPDKILCGAGSLDLIGALALCFAGPRDAVLAPAHAYPFFRTATQIAGARFDTAPETDLTVDAQALIDAVRPDTRIVFVANPANPTGTRIDKSGLAALRRGLRPDILLVIDEAYGEFSDHALEPCWDMVADGTCVVLRTFSKAYGLAGLRVGWGLFPEGILGHMRKVMNPNGVSGVAQSAALAALEDQDYMHETCAMTASLRNQTRAALIGLGFDMPPSFTNFLLIRFADAGSADSANVALQDAGIRLRPQSGAGLPHTLRLTIGPSDAMNAVLSRLSSWRKEIA